MKRPNGFSILEMLVVLGLMGFVFFVASQLFHATMEAWRMDTRMADHNARVDAAIAKLRVDVWHSQSMQAVNSQNAIMTLASGDQIAWSIESDGTLVRAHADGSERFEAAGPGWSFHVDGSSLFVEDVSRPQEMCLQSECLLLARISP